MNNDLHNAMAHHTAGRLAEAEKIYRQILSRDPDHPDAIHLLGLIASQVGRPEAAVPLIERAIALRPEVGGYNENLGHAYAQLGQIERARAAYIKAVQLSPDSPSAYYNLANFLRGIGENEPAIEAYRGALRNNPNFGQAHNNLGLTLSAAGRLDEAIAELKRADQLLPNSPEVKTALGMAHLESGMQDEALALFDRVVELDPKSLVRSSNRVYSRHYHPDSDPESLLEAARKWDEAHGNPLGDAKPVYPNDRSPERRLRVGYVSPDLRDHVVGQHIRPLFSEHDRKRFEIFVYSSAEREDALSQLLRSYCTGWRNIVKMNDAQAAALIRADQIDVLVDLALHTEGNRLGVFTHRPAPVQISFFGYCSTTGLSSMGWRLSDPWIDPPGSNVSEDPLGTPPRHSPLAPSVGFRRTGQGEGRMSNVEPSPLTPTLSPSVGFRRMGARGESAVRDGGEAAGEITVRTIPDYSERTIVLPHTHLCYQPPAYAPEVNGLPAKTSGRITFGCLNNFAKVTPAAMETWAQILAAVPGSRLIVHSKAGSHRGVARERFERSGVSRDRLEFVGRLPRREYHAKYGQFDIALDTFPYSGGITTCDALWMGVPVITLRGRTAVGRVATSILGNAGLSEFSAASIEAYKTKAVEIAGDLNRLVELRKTLREKMRASATMDGPGYARDIEAAYRHAWREFCSNAPA